MVVQHSGRMSELGTGTGKLDTSVKDKKRPSSEVVPTTGHDTELRRVQLMKPKWARNNDEQGEPAAS